jgi:glucosamine--fructose-6-phosphate aminotransferase (isomerizing)
MAMTSLYETNILNKPTEWKRLLNLPLPEKLKNLQTDRIVFIGIGSSYWVARFAEFLWREYNAGTSITTTTTPSSIQSFDFVRSKYVVSKNDFVVVFSHRGTKNFSMKALEIAKERGATTVLITGIGSPLATLGQVNFRIETCPQENCGAFTISLTSAITRIIQWIGMYNTVFLERFKDTANILEKELSFKVRLPKSFRNLVVVGDLIREIVAHEVALKISETSYLPVRSFGLEEFLHGPRVTLDDKSSLIIFSSMTDPRRETLIHYAKTVGCQVLDIHEDLFGLPKEFSWLGQLLWGQLLAFEISRTLKINPDTARADQHVYNEARKALTL